MTDLTTDEAILRQWIGRTETCTATVDAEPARRMQALLDREPTLADGDALPPLWTWLYFQDNHRPACSSATAARCWAISCRRSPCRGACGPAGGFASTAR